jgi:uncharacterized protein (UPF0335 family)
MDGSGHNQSAAERLLKFVQRLEALDEDKRDIATQISEVKKEAKEAGFDVPTINQMVRERRMSQEERDARDALRDLYRASLGMLGDTPLGEAAIRRLEKRRKPDKKPDSGAPAADGAQAPDVAPDAPEAPQQPAAAEFMPGVTVDEAELMGRQAAADGKSVIENPFPARDPRRARWDMGWCQESGSDGMDIPEAWRRDAKKKPDDAAPAADQAPSADGQAGQADDANAAGGA